MEIKTHTYVDDYLGILQFHIFYIYKCTNTYILIRNARAYISTIKIYNNTVVYTIYCAILVNEK